MARQFPEASRIESLRFASLHIVPNLVQGLFRRRPWAVRWSGRIDVDARAVRAARELRAKYGGPGVVLRMGSDDSLLLWGRDAIRHVFDHSPDPYGPPGVKLKGMGHFQPDAVTLSTGTLWRDRRRFNEAVLDFGRTAHRDAGAFHDVVRREVAACVARVGARDGVLAWDDLADLLERMTLQVIFGAAARDDDEVADLLEELMSRANTPVALDEDSEDYVDLQESIRRYLTRAEAGSLAHRASEAATGPSTDPPDQVPHWMFAMKDTLAVNVARALAVIVADARVEARVRDELASVDASDPRAVARLAYLGGCVQEAMRLWPTTPLLSRELARDDEIDGYFVEAGTQILVSNLFNHRDPDRVDRADDFVPERFIEGETNRSPDVLFNHLSRGPQICAGIDLALYLARAVLAALLGSARLGLLEPEIDGAARLPHMLDAYELRFALADRDTAGARR